MNYIRHLHAFYHQVKRDNRLSSTHVSLYLAIFQYWNYNRFQNPFRINREELMSLSKIGSKNTYHKCMKELHSFQYIVYHTTLSKYQPVKLSMIRLDLKQDENALRQLDLFASNEEDSKAGKLISPGNSEVTSNDKKSNSHPHVFPSENESHACTNFDTHTSTDFDTHACAEIETHACPNNGTVRVPNLTATCPKNGTTRVPFLGHLIKHKHLNSKQCVFKTKKNTPTTIFEKNIKSEKAITKLAGLDSPAVQKQDVRPVPISVHGSQRNNLPGKDETAITLEDVKAYFRQNAFPIAEAQKFFFYNKGRGWMLTDTVCIKDWTALAQKWMLNDLTTKTNHNVAQGKGPIQSIDPGPGKDYSEPL